MLPLYQFQHKWNTISMAYCKHFVKSQCPKGILMYLQEWSSLEVSMLTNLELKFKHLRVVLLVEVSLKEFLNLVWKSKYDLAISPRIKRIILNVYPSERELYHFKLKGMIYFTLFQEDSSVLACSSTHPWLETIEWSVMSSELLANCPIFTSK